MKITHYTYEADQHCVGCTQERFAPRPHQSGVDMYASAGFGSVVLSPALPQTLDENRVPLEAVDSEGNVVGVAFDINEYERPWMCGTCGGIFETESIPANQTEAPMK